MKNAQDLNALQAGHNTVRNNIAGIRNNEFAGAVDAARVAKSGVIWK